MDDVEVIESGDDGIAREIKKRMKLIDGKLNEIRVIRAEIRELNKKKVRKRPITIRVPADKRDEIKKRIEEILGEYEG